MTSERVPEVVGPASLSSCQRLEGFHFRMLNALLADHDHLREELQEYKFALSTQAVPEATKPEDKDAGEVAPVSASVVAAEARADQAEKKLKEVQELYAEFEEKKKETDQQLWEVKRELTTARRERTRAEGRRDAAQQKQADAEEAAKRAQDRVKAVEQEVEQARAERADAVAELTEAKAGLARLQEEASKVKAAQIAEKTARQAHDHLKEELEAAKKKAAESAEMVAELETENVALKDQVDKAGSQGGKPVLNPSQTKTLAYLKRSLRQWEEQPDRSIKNLQMAIAELEGAKAL
ncbi:hypothetical protein [Corynebacterium cystitidis]|uniref:hypothetical protein n=1 Tax=Corynebacterium cystitidis TaxID=35757 RepID=UPI00211EA106|nr:hypothetical protein [Corynebacterium cystitidis]